MICNYLKRIKKRISDVLVKHYSIIKDLDYNFKELITDEENLLLYNKLEHFSNKPADKLLDLYLNNVFEYYFSEEESITTEILRTALYRALIQSEEGVKKLLEYIVFKTGDPNGDFENKESFIYEDMPYLVYPLTEHASDIYAPFIFGLYFSNMDFIAYAEECNYYFSNISNNRVIKAYLYLLKSLNNNGIEDYHYDIAEYLNSKELDKYLFNILKRTKDNLIKENIMRILASKYYKEIIPYALEYIKENEDEVSGLLGDSIYPLLILENCNDEISKKIIKEVENEFSV